MTYFKNENYGSDVSSIFGGYRSQQGVLGACNVVRNLMFFMKMSIKYLKFDVNLAKFYARYEKANRKPLQITYKIVLKNLNKLIFGTGVWALVPVYWYQVHTRYVN